MVKYSLVIYLDEKLTQKIRVIQNALSILTGSRASLNFWEPHITIGAGVEVTDKDFSSFCKEIEEAIKNLKPFKVKIKNYGFMDNWMGGKLKGYAKYVIYLNIIKNKKLQNLFLVIKEKVTDKRTLFYGQISSYNPHLTVAFKDLDKKSFFKAKEIFKKEKFEDEILVDHIALAKENKKGRWKECKKFEF